MVPRLQQVFLFQPPTRSLSSNRIRISNNRDYSVRTNTGYDVQGVKCHLSSVFVQI